jgi:hypothetical protein
MANAPTAPDHTECFMVNISTREKNFLRWRPAKNATTVIRAGLED